MKLRHLFILLGLIPFSTHAALINIFDSRTDFISALGGAATETQDFSAYADNTSLAGVEILPGVTSTFTRGSHSSAPLAYFGGMFRDIAFTGMGNSSIFEFQIGGAYSAFGFDIRSHDPNTPGPVDFEIVATDGTNQVVSLVPGNVTESQAYFFGVIADIGLDLLRYGEGPELGGSSTGLFTRMNCCEETVIDNLVAASVNVPEPGILALLGAGLLGLFGIQKIRSA